MAQTFSHVIRISPQNYLKEIALVLYVAEVINFGIHVQLPGHSPKKIC